MQRDAAFPLLLLCFFLSGLAGLVYETAWTREFTFVFGTSNLAVATVLAAYMAGLAAGAAAAARLSHRVRRPVLAYGVLELGIGLAALGVPLAIRAARVLYVGLFGGQAGLPGVGGLPTALFYGACSFVILMVPTAMMGATLPLLARHAVRRQEEIGSRIGQLYAANTAGAVVGTLLAAFLLLPALGLRQTIWVAALVNGAVFAAAWALARSAGSEAAAPAPVRKPAARRVSWILPLIFASGAVSFSYEVLWVRLLEHVLGGSVYAFATMLASFLAGIALGAAVASRLAATPAGAALGFAFAQLCIGLLSLAAFTVVGEIPELTSVLRRGGAPALLGDASAAMLTLFPAAVAIGATFPLAVRVLARSEVDAGPVSARVYAANTFGSIVGAVGAGFFVVPALGYAGTLVACVATNLALAAAAALVFRPRRPLLVLVACASAALLIAVRPATPWEILGYSWLTRRHAQGQVEYYGVGRAATVLLLVAPRGRWYLRTNGAPEGSIDPPMVWHNRSALERWLTALPLLARPSARSLLSVGLGAGVALEVVPPAVERIDVVELEPEVVAANRAVGPFRWRDPLADPRLQLHLNDARNALLLTQARFDAIVSQPSHPWSSGASHLYTREFFELAKSRLAEDGVFTQWIGLAFVDELLFRSLLATLTAVFENVRVYSPYPMGGALFLASDGELDVERSAARALAAAPEEFATLGILVPEDVEAWLMLDEAGSRALGRGAPVNRDDHNLLQSRAPRILDHALRQGITALVAPVDPFSKPRPSGSDPFYLLRRLPLERAERLAGTLPGPVDRRVAEALIAIERGEGQRGRQGLGQALRIDPGHLEARAALIRLALSASADDGDGLDLVPSPLDEVERTLVTAWRAQQAGDPEAIVALDAALAAVPPRHPLAQAASRLRAEWRIASGEPALALEAIEIADKAIWDGPHPGDMLLRARACVVAEQPAAALDALNILSLRPGGSSRSRATARQGLDLVRAIRVGPQLELVRGKVERQLEARSE